MQKNTLHKGIGLGYTAKGKRVIHEGREYANLWGNVIGTDPVLHKNGEVSDTVEFAARIVAQTLHQTKAISEKLKRPTLNETCKAIWEYCYKHYAYKIDKPGVEQLRSPARAWKDRKIGIDCDCFAITVSSILTNMGITHYFRIVKMYGRDYFQHIYVVVPKVKNADMNIRPLYHVIDPVVDRYDLEPPGVTFKTDYKMEGMPIQYLNGTDGCRLGEEFNGLGDSLGDGLGSPGNDLYDEFLGRMKMHLRNTRDHIRKNPGKVAAIYRPEALAAMYDRLLGAWDDEAQREATLEHLSGIEEEALQPHLQGLGDVIHGSDDELWGLINATELLDFEEETGISGYDGLGKKAKKKAARKAATGSSKPKKKAGVFTKIKKATQAVKKVTQKGKEVVKKTVAKGKAVAKKVATKVKSAAKKVAKALVKFNPVSTAARAGFLLAMKINFGRFASRAYWALVPESVARAKGVTPDYINRSKQAYEALKRVFVKTLKGKEENLKKAILNGRAAKKVGNKSVKGYLSGLDALADDYMKDEDFGLLEGAITTVMRPYPAHMAKLRRTHKTRRRLKKRILSKRGAAMLPPGQAPVRPRFAKASVMPVRATAVAIKGLGEVEEEMEPVFGSLGAAPAVSVASAMAFLTPLLNIFNKLFKGKKAGAEVTEGGGEALPPNDPESSEAGADFQVKDDDSDTYARKANDTPVPDDDEDFTPPSGSRQAAPGTQNADDEGGADDDDDEGSGKPKKKGISTGAVVAVTAGAGLLLLAVSAGKKKSKTEGVDGPEKKRISTEVRKCARKLGKRGGKATASKTKKVKLS